MADEPRQLVTVSRETTALTTLPDALIDDDAVSPMAKMAYWYLKRHGGRIKVAEVAKMLGVSRHSTWSYLLKLGIAGWITISSDQPPERGIVQFVVRETNLLTAEERSVHAVPAVKR